MFSKKLFCFFMAIILMSCLLLPAQSNDSPGFFLKITKNVPRLGRRSDDNFFLKNMRAIPRIGRHTNDNPMEFLDVLSWLAANDNKKVSTSKRMYVNPATPIATAAMERELSVVQPVNANTLIELLEKNAIPSDHVKFVHWKDFDRALQMDSDLYGKVVSLGRKPDMNFKADLGISSYIPLFGHSSDNVASDGDFVLYNKGVDGQTFANEYGHDFLSYNYVK